MQDVSHTADVAAIQRIVARQFESLCWSDGAPRKLSQFLDDCHPQCVLFPARRPARQQTAEAFIARMADLAKGDLNSFHEEVLGTQITVFGNVAVAVAGSQQQENGATGNRACEMMLLVREASGWKIAAQAWDTESASERLPASLAQTSA